MQPELKPKKVRLNVQISSELKGRLSQLSAFQGKRVSTLVRQSIEKKLEQIEKDLFAEEMKHAYQALAKENLTPGFHALSYGRPAADLHRDALESA